MKNIYCEFLNIPYQTGIDPTKFNLDNETCFKHIKFDESLLNPDLVNWFKEFKIKFLCYEAFYTPPNGGIFPIHTDQSGISDIAKINWTYGAPGSKIIWWEVTDESKILEVKSKFDVSAWACEEKYCQKVYEQEILHPSLINAGRFHSTFNPSNEKRWTISLPIYDLTSNRRLHWPESYERLRDYIIEPDDIPGVG